jgi:c-di-GMP-binding flagellar brake protein YcgR
MPDNAETKRADEVLRPGQFVHLGIPDEDAEDGLRIMQGRLIELALRYFAVELKCPVKDFLSSPDAGTEIACAVAGDGCVYRFPAGFRGSTRLPEQQWFLDKPETVSRIQMREFVRVPLELPLAVRLPGGHGSLHTAKATTLVDISGGGLSFVNDEKVLLSANIAIAIPEIPGFGQLKAHARVKRCTPITTPTGRTVYHIGAQFEEDDFSHAEQERLIQTVFDLQRSYLQRGLRMPNIDHTHRSSAKDFPEDTEKNL